LMAYFDMPGQALSSFLCGKILKPSSNIVAVVCPVAH